MIYTESELPIEAYLASQRLSHSPLKMFAELGPNGFYRSRIQREWSPEDTKHYVTGRACEDALQRPELYAQRYVAKPKGMSFGSKEGDAWRGLVTGTAAELTGAAATVARVAQWYLTGNPPAPPFAVKPADMNFRDPAGKAWKAAQEAAGNTIITMDESTAGQRVAALIGTMQPPREVVDSSDSQAILALKETLQANELACELIAAASMQMTIAHDSPGDSSADWDMALPGLQSRPDWLGLRGCAASDFYPYVLDLKTTKSLADLASGKAVRQNGYHRQAAMVRKCLALEGVDVRNLRYFLLGAEKTFPYRWQVFELTPRLVSEGEAWCDEQLRKLARHFANSDWPLITQELVTVDVQRWGVVDDAEDDDDAESEVAA